MTPPYPAPTPVQGRPTPPAPERPAKPQAPSGPQPFSQQSATAVKALSEKMTAALKDGLDRSELQAIVQLGQHILTMDDGAHEADRVQARPNLEGAAAAVAAGMAQA